MWMAAAAGYSGGSEFTFGPRLTNIYPGSQMLAGIVRFLVEYGATGHQANPISASSGRWSEATRVSRFWSTAALPTTKSSVTKMWSRRISG